MTRPETKALPLEKNCLFQSSDLDETRAIIAGKFCDHRLDQVSRHSNLKAVHNRAEGQSTSLNFISYGADVEIEPGELGSFYLIQVPLTGRAWINNSAGDVETGPGLGSVLNPHRHTSMRWQDGCSQLLLQIDAQQLNRVAERLIGRPLAAPVSFETAVNQSLPDVKRWIGNLRTCFTLAGDKVIYSKGNLHTLALIEEQLIEGFLMCQPSDIIGLLAEDTDRAKNLHVRRAIRYMRAHFRDPITIGDISDALQISARALQLGFRSEMGMTPMQYLRETRLREARHLLMTHSIDQTVGDICEAVGFGHFGRFSVEYKQRFGESPNKTRQFHS